MIKKLIELFMGGGMKSILFHKKMNKRDKQLNGIIETLDKLNGEEYTKRIIVIKD